MWLPFFSLVEMSLDPGGERLRNLGKGGNFIEHLGEGALPAQAAVIGGHRLPNVSQGANFL